MVYVENEYRIITAGLLIKVLYMSNIVHIVEYIYIYSILQCLDLNHEIWHFFFRQVSAQFSPKRETEASHLIISK
jgi:hypothetical protein